MRKQVPSGESKALGIHLLDASWKVEESRNTGSAVPVGVPETGH